ncbi:MAG: AraC family transcriptional regulator [Gammaproteobacteria bacterium]
MEALSSRDPIGQPGSISIDAVLRVLPVVPYATTRERGWNGVTVDVYRAVPGCAASYPAFDHHSVYYCTSGSARLMQGRDGVVHDGTLAAGMSAIMPAGYDSTWEGDVTATARLRIPPSLIDTAGEQLGRRCAASVEIRNVFETRDSMIERVALMLTGELERKPHPTQALIVDGLSCSLAAHLLRGYNAFGPVEQYQPPSLGRAELARLTGYIEDNLDRRIGLAELAALVNVSRFHFARLFKRSTGMTAIAFVEQCRIRRAQSLIAESSLPLADIALLTGFADQSHFTRRFHRHVGCTPAVFAVERGRRRSK